MPLKYMTLYNNLNFVNSGKTEENRIARFHNISDPELKTFLNFVYHPKIEWLLLDNFEYTPSRDEPNALLSVLLREIRKLPRFLNIGPYPTLTKEKRTKLFIDVLEVCHPKDAELLFYVAKNRKLPFENINIDLIKKAFPKFTSEWDKNENKPNPK